MPTETWVDSNSGKACSTKQMEAASGQIRLGGAIYHPETERVVTASGDDVLLRSQSARVLRMLVTRLGRLSPRDTLIAEVWPNVSVTDDSLTQCILDIRRAIGDHDRSILKTVPKRGYVLHGEHLAASSFGQSPQDPDRAPTETAHATPLPMARDAIAPHQTDADRPGILPELDPRDVLPTLAVLPFRVPPESGRAAIMNAYLGDEIAGGISRSNDMNVISRLSTLELGQGVTDLTRLRYMLNADFILSGSLFERDDASLLLLEFAETTSQRVLWSDRMALPHRAWMEDDCVDRIVTQIRRAIMMNEVRRIRSSPLRDLKLFSVLHGAVGLMHRFAPKDFNLAQSYLAYVIEQAPDHPTPLAWLARWHVLRAVQGWTDDPQTEARAALDFTSRALDINPDHTLALVSEGQVLAHLAHRLDEAETRYNAALAITPNDAQCLALRGMFSAIRDLGAEGKRDTERALHLSPFHPHRFFFLAQAAAANIAAKDYPRAVTLARESLRLNRTHVSTLRTLAIAQVGADQMDEARRTAAELMRLQPNMRVSNWLRNSPSSGYELGRSAAEKLKLSGIPH
ncbi:winged helix-turn-helix domain-containing tetratricopeptide repeat protein [Roseivivax sp. THAF40]|nr:winged helix-turn-helix domain-containing protein [Roseivivax sp. THAF40]